MERDSFIFYRSWLEAILNLPRDLQGDVLLAITRYAILGDASADGLKPIARAMLAMAKPQIDANNQRYANGCNGGRRNQRPTENESGGNRKQTEVEPKANQRPTENESGGNRKQTEVEPKANQRPTENEPNEYVYENENVYDNNINPHSSNDELPPLPGAALPQDEISVDSDDGLKASETTPPPGSAPPPSPKRKVFKKPTVDEIRAYCAERHNSVDAEHFYDHYEANGWKIGGKSPMKDWRAAVRTWEKNNYTSYGRKEQQKFGNTRPGDFAGKGYTDI